ncbi:Prokineticin-2 [Aix galericulata]|nr:Prokineticin-2 [Aix galericulata]
MCCAVSLWIRSLRMCTPMGNLGEECHPLSHRGLLSTGWCWPEDLDVINRSSAGDKPDNCSLCAQVPFPGRRMHHTCPCLPSLACARTSPSKFRCLPDFRKEDVFF